VLRILLFSLPFAVVLPVGISIGEVKIAAPDLIIVGILAIMTLAFLTRFVSSPLSWIRFPKTSIRLFSVPGSGRHIGGIRDRNFHPNFIPPHGNDPLV